MDKKSFNIEWIIIWKQASSSYEIKIPQIRQRNTRQMLWNATEISYLCGDF